MNKSCMPFTLVNQTGYYHDDVREWRANLMLTKRGPTSKLTFSRPKKSNEEPTTANQAGYNAAAEATMAAAAEALANLATTNSTSTSGFAKLDQPVGCSHFQS
jgi:hypothetical protein